MRNAKISHAITIILHAGLMVFVLWMASSVQAAESAQVKEDLVKGSPLHVEWESNRFEGTSTLEFGLTGDGNLFGKITKDSGHSHSQVGEISGLKMTTKD